MPLTAKAISDDLTNPNSISSRWGIQANEYLIGGKQVDLQDLMVMITKNRAVAVEGEVEPLASIIRKRNEKLDRFGVALAGLTNFQTAFTKDDEGDDDGHGWFHADVADVLIKDFGYSCPIADNTGDRDSRPPFYQHVENHSEYSAKKRFVEEAIQRLKSAIDGLNNEAQLDMSRMQQLVDSRDQAYSAATNLMTAISDTRANSIRNM